MSVTRARRRPGPWIATAAATAVSTYALDGVATATGVALAASGLLAALSHDVLLPVLAVSYLACSDSLCLAPVTRKPVVVTLPEAFIPAG